MGELCVVVDTVGGKSYSWTIAASIDIEQIVKRVAFTDVFTSSLFLLSSFLSLILSSLPILIREILEVCIFMYSKHRYCAQWKRFYRAGVIKIF